MASRIKKIIGVLFLICCLCINNTGVVCATETDGFYGTITVMSNLSQEEMQKYADMFTSKYPGLTVEYIYLENYNEQALEMMESGDYADVLFIPGSMSSDNMGKYFEPLGTVDELSEKYNYIDKSFKNGDVVYGIPSYAYTSGFLYNKAVFEKAGITQIPKTTDEFLEALRCIDEYTDAVPFYTNYDSSWALNTWENFPYIEMTGDVNYKENDFVKIENPFSQGSTHDVVYSMLYRIVEEGLCEENIGSGDWNESKTLLNEGKIACIAIGSWALSQFKNAGEYGDDVAFMPFPNEIDGKQYATISTDYPYAINRNSNMKEAAKAYIDFMLDESGFALDRDNLSIVKTDPYPDSFTEMEDIIFLSNAAASPETTNYFQILSSQLDLQSGTEQKRIIEAASGKTDESWDDIRDDWNERWESSRTSDMKVENEVISFFADGVSLTQEISFSDAELSYIENLDVVSVGYLEEYAPFQSEVDGEFVGLSAGVCARIEENTGIKFNYKPYKNYSEIVNAMENGEIDMAAGIESSADYDDKVRLSKGYIDYTQVLVMNVLNSVESMERGTGVFIENHNMDYYKGLDRISYQNDVEGTLDAVDGNKADYTIMNYYSANYYIQKNGYSNVNVVAMNKKGEMYLGFSNSTDKRLIAICNKCLYALSDSDVEMMMLNSMDTGAEKLTVRRFIEIYSVQCIIVLSLLFIFILVMILFVFHERAKSARKHELDAARYRILAELTDEYVFDYNHKNRELNFDRKFAEEFLFDRKVSLDSYDEDNVALKQFIVNFNRLKDNEKLNELEAQYTYKDKGDIWYRMIVSRIYNEKKQLIQIIGKFGNIQKEIEQRKRILDKAEKDALTGIFNREGFNSVFQRVQACSSENGCYLLAMLDLDNFKSVNDTLGHSGGDKALQLLAKNLQELFGDIGVVSRFGGDEFNIYIPNVKYVQAIEKRMAELVRVMNQTLIFNGKERLLSISMGAVVVPNTVNEDDAMSKADAVLYEVKKNGKNNFICKVES